MLIPSSLLMSCCMAASLSRRVNANSQLDRKRASEQSKLIKKGEC